MKKLIMALMVGALLFALVSCDKIETLEVDSTELTTWAKTFGTATGNEQGNCVIQTSDGGYAACGVTSGLSVDSLEEDVVIDSKNNVYVVKADSSGAKVWEKAFGGDGDDHGNVIIETSDGGFLVVGEKMVLVRYDVYIIKLDASGNKVWEKTYGETDKNEWGFGVTEAPDGGFVIVGMVGTGVSPDDQAYGLWFKIDSSGNMLWESTFVPNASQHIQFNSIEPTSNDGFQTSNDGFIICGTRSKRFRPRATDSFPLAKSAANENQPKSANGWWPGGFFYIIKIASDGSIIWERAIQYKNAPSCSWVAKQTPDGGYIVSGGAHGRFRPISSRSRAGGYNVSGGADGLVIFGYFGVVVAKLSPSGNIQWILRYGGRFDGWRDEGAYIDLTDDGGYIVASRHSSLDRERIISSMIYLLKIDAQGTKVWSKKYRLHRYTFANWIRTVDDGGFIITGGTGNDMLAMFMMKTDSDGNVEDLEAVPEP